ncbi:MAG: hypothetical protein M3Y34_07370, partial [Actinomycetota bacterium]|nr:hypothetical protein [Actinomycetota bacterium]
CVYGGSAGANFALVLAARERVDCVIADAPATDLATLPDSIKKQFVAPAFGSELDEFSPVKLAQRRPGSYADTRIVIGHFEDDVVTPIDQSTRLADALPFEVPVFELPEGPAPFEHGAVEPAALDEYHAAQSSLLADVADSWRFADAPFAAERVAEIIRAAANAPG